MKHSVNYSLIVATVCLAGCGTFQLSSGAIPNSPKSQEQMQLDNLTCKDKAQIEANTASRQAGAFALGLTIVGTPIAFELEKSKQREVYKDCMEKLGYRVLPPADGPAVTNTSTQTQTQPATPARQPERTRAMSRPSTPASQPEPTGAVSQPGKDEAVQLEKLKELRDKGLLSTDEYERKRKEIIDRM